MEENLDHAWLVGRAIQRFEPTAQVHTAADPDEAVECLSTGEFRPDLVLLGINLPGGSGFDVLRHISSYPDLHVIPIVVLTSSGDSEHFTRAYEFGAAGLVSKPLAAVAPAKFHARDPVSQMLSALERELRKYRFALTRKLVDRMEVFNRRCFTDAPNYEYGTARKEPDAELLQLEAKL